MDFVEAVGEGADRLAQSLLGQIPWVLTGLIIFAVSLLLARGVRHVIERARWTSDHSLRTLAAGIGSALTIVLGVFLALWVAVPSVRFTELLTSLGVTGIILGFALRDILENFVAGVIILARRPFGVGDQIRSGDYEGTVIDINFRSTVVRTYDGLMVYLPNGSLLTAPVENLTAYGVRRSEVRLGIDPSASVARTRELILSTLATSDDVLDDPTAMVFFREVGDFANQLDVIFWTMPPTRLHQRSTESEVTERLYSALQDAGIGFPYPTTTVQLADGRERH